MDSVRTFLERRRKYLQMMSIHYGFIQPNEIDMEALFEAGTIHLPTNTWVTGFEDLVDYQIDLVSGLKKITPIKTNASMAITFSDSMGLSAPAVVVFEIGFEVGVNIQSGLKFYRGLKLNPNNITFAFENEGKVEVYNSMDVETQNILIGFGITALVKQTALEKLGASFEDQQDMSAVLAEKTTPHIEGNIAPQVDISIGLIKQTMPSISTEQIFEVDFNASMNCEKWMKLQDYASKYLNNMSGTLSSLEYLII